MKNIVGNDIKQQTLPHGIGQTTNHTPRFVLEYFENSASTKLKDIVGRQSAGAGLIRAILNDQSVNRPSIAVASVEQRQVLKSTISKMGYEPSDVEIGYIGDIVAMAQSGCSIGMDPELGERLWRRRLIGDRSYSIVGATHSLVSKSINKFISDLVVDPVQPWDAMICTSKSAVSVVTNIMENYREYLRRRGLNSPLPPIQLPIIPIGIHTGDFVSNQIADGAAAAFRQGLGIKEQDVMLLSFGRIDPFNKSHPTPLIQAMALARQLVGSEVTLHLVMVGQTPNAETEAEVKHAIATHATGAKIHLVDGSDPELSKHSWHAADVFISLSDNIQETFGLTPIEAMASGLPLIVSDWNGYRDTVSSDSFGIRIPTFMPNADDSIGRYFSDRYAANIDNYSNYVGSIAQMSAVDIGAASIAIAELAKNPERRRQMGEAARRHAVTNYDWQVIMSRYTELVAELEHRRDNSSGTAVRNPGKEVAMVTVPDPLRIFADHPSNPVGLSSLLKKGPIDDVQTIDWLYQEKNAGFVKHALLPLPQIKILHDAIGDKPVRLRKLCKIFSDYGNQQVVSTCMWLTKYSFLTLTNT